MVKHKSTAKFVENLRSLVDNSRTHTIVCDVPTSKGGNDKGPTALELALMSLSDCAVTIFALIAKQSKIDVKKIEVETEAEKLPGDPIIKGVKMKVKVAAKARKQLIDAVWRRTEASCPVVKIFTEKIPIEIEVVTETV